MRPEFIADENSRLVIRSRSRQRIKYVPYPVQADLCIGVTSLGIRKMLSRRWVCSPSASMCGGGPDN
jgi:hypothetical protein